MKKITLEIRESDSGLYDINGLYVGILGGGMIGFEPESAASSIEDICKLKDTGFTADEIIELKKRDVI